MTRSLGAIHGRCVHSRRIRVLSRHLASVMPRGASILDIGCGDGRLSRAISEARPDLDISGVDIIIRGETHIPVEPFDGRRLPHADGRFDVALLADVLHHAGDPHALLHEALRVSRGVVVIKDHVRRGILAGPTLRFMDWFANAPHGVALPYNYWTEGQWQRAFDDLGVRVSERITDLGLYPRPADWLFGRSLHFVARVESDGP